MSLILISFPPGHSALLDTPRGLWLLIGRQHLRGCCAGAAASSGC